LVETAVSRVWTGLTPQDLILDWPPGHAKVKMGAAH
jgi:hypothetical protein